MHYVQHPARRLAEYRQTLPRGRGSVSLTLSPFNEESWEQGLASLHLLGDELVDTFLALLAAALDIHGSELITLPFAITPEDILAICRKKKSKGSYRSRQRQSVLAQIDTLARISVRAILILRDGRQWQVESPLLEILRNEPPEENETRPEHANWPPWYLKIGGWEGGLEVRPGYILPSREEIARLGHLSIGLRSNLNVTDIVKLLVPLSASFVKYILTSCM